MKNIIIISITIVLTCITVAVWAQKTEKSNGISSGSIQESNRYQLFQGRYTINNEGTAFTASDIFKIDTVTGKTWIYREAKTDGKLYNRWESLDNN